MPLLEQNAPEIAKVGTKPLGLVAPLAGITGAPPVVGGWVQQLTRDLMH